MVKKINNNLSADQKLILFEEGTEPPGSSELNNEKRVGAYHCANCDVKLFESSTNMKVDPDGHHFMKRYQMLLKLKLITL